MSLIVDDSVRRALEEDLGAAGDITTDATVPSDVRGSARIVARAAGTVAGLQLAQTTFRLVDSDLTWTQREEDGKAVAAGAELAHLAGRARSILTGERTALNFLGHLSGVATATADLVRRVAGTGTGIVDTRKTTPGLRAAEKYAVRMGGGSTIGSGYTMPCWSRTTTSSPPAASELP